MVSTRLQSNNNSNCGESSSTLSISETNSKVPSSTGCVTRSSNASTASAAGNSNQICHSKDIIQSKPGFNLLDLPTEIIENIISCCEYKTAAHMRILCKRMNQICGYVLNKTFNRLHNSMSERFTKIKAQMPRRDSVRRQHPLACEYEIIEMIYMQLNLLHMNFGKHIEKKLLFFFPGEVLDEIHRILYYIKVAPKLPRSYKVTEELFDLVSMAIEYFKEKLEPKLPEVTYYGTDLIKYSPTTRDSTVLFDKRNLSVDFSVQSVADEDLNQPYPPQSNMVLRKRIRKIKQGMKLYNSQLTTMKRELKGYQKKMTEQQKTILEYATRLDDNDKKNEEISRKFSALLQELNKCKTEFQYWRSKAPLNPVCGNCGATFITPPIEDLEAMSDQGAIVPFVVVPPLAVESGEESNKIVDIEEAGRKDLEKMCSKEDVDSSPKEVNAVAMAVDDDSEGSEIACCNIMLKDRSVRPAKRKQVSEKQNFKRPRGILKLRSKTIRIMK